MAFELLGKDCPEALGRGGWPISHLGGGSILLGRCKGVACKPMWLLRLAHLCDVGEGGGGSGFYVEINGG
jgi:hypothetical protein